MRIADILKADTSLSKSTVRDHLGRTEAPKVADIARRIEHASNGEISRYSLLFPEEQDTPKILRTALRDASLIIWHNSFKRGDTPEEIEKDLIALATEKVEGSDNAVSD